MVSVDRLSTAWWLSTWPLESIYLGSSLCFCIIWQVTGTTLPVGSLLDILIIMNLLTWLFSFKMLIIKIVLILITDFLWHPLKFLTQRVCLTCLSLFLASCLSLFTYKNEIKNSHHFTGLWQEIREINTLTECKTTHCQICKLWLLFSLTLQVCSSYTGEGGTL